MKRAVAYCLAGVELLAIGMTAQGAFVELEKMGASVAAALAAGFYLSMMVTTVLVMLLDSIRCPSDVRFD